jgi:hypothetical protein
MHPSLCRVSCIIPSGRTHAIGLWAARNTANSHTPCRYLRNATPQRVSQRCSGASTWCWELHQTITWRRALTLLGIKRCLWIREPVWENGVKLAGRRLLWGGKPASC